MQINAALLAQWEPQIHSMLKRAHLVGIEYEDAVQELRIEIVRAAQNFDETYGTKFHTLLYVYMQNRIRQLIKELQKHKLTSSLSEFDTPFAYRIEDVYQHWEDVFSNCQLSSGEKIILDLALCGFRKREIKALCVDEKLFDTMYRTLRVKIGKLAI